MEKKLVNAIGLYTWDQVQASIGEAFFVLGNLTGEDMATSIAMFKEQTAEFERMKGESLDSIPEIDRQIAQLQALKQARKTYAEQAEAVIQKREGVLATVSRATADTTAYTIKPFQG